MIELSIIIVHYHNPALLKLCLHSLAKDRLSIAHEIIVVDSATTRKSQQTIRESFPEAKLIPVEYNTGYARGVNLGINESSGQYILILNPDIIVLPGAIESMLNFIKDRPDIGLLGPQLLNLNGSIQNSCFRFYTFGTILARRAWLGRWGFFKKTLADFLMADADLTKLQAPDWLSGAALMTSRKAIETVGAMDQDFFMYFEDVDWAKRFWQNGYKVIYYPPAQMYHIHERGSRSKLEGLDLFFNKQARWHVRSAIRYFWKHRHRHEISN